MLELPYLNLDFQKSVKESLTFGVTDFLLLYPKETTSAYSLTKVQSPISLALRKIKERSSADKCKRK